jgi:hypothetical protein
MKTCLYQKPSSTNVSTLIIPETKNQSRSNTKLIISGNELIRSTSQISNYSLKSNQFQSQRDNREPYRSPSNIALRSNCNSQLSIRKLSKTSNNQNQNQNQNQNNHSNHQIHIIPELPKNSLLSANKIYKTKKSRKPSKFYNDSRDIIKKSSSSMLSVDARPPTTMPLKQRINLLTDHRQDHNLHQINQNQIPPKKILSKSSTKSNRILVSANANNRNSSFKQIPKPNEVIDQTNKYLKDQRIKSPIKSVKSSSSLGNQKYQTPTHMQNQFFKPKKSSKKQQNQLNFGQKLKYVSAFGPGIATNTPRKISNSAEDVGLIVTKPVYQSSTIVRHQSGPHLLDNNNNQNIKKDKPKQHKSFKSLRQTRCVSRDTARNITKNINLDSRPSTREKRGFILQDSEARKLISDSINDLDMKRLRQLENAVCKKLTERLASRQSSRDSPRGDRNFNCWVIKKLEFITLKNLSQLTGFT